MKVFGNPQRNLRAFALIVLTLTLPSFGRAQTASSQDGTVNRPDTNKTIYVSDFELDPANFKQDKGGITGKGYLLPAPPKSFLRRTRRAPNVAAHNLVDLMSDSLVSDLQKAGYHARRLSPNEPWPTEGLIVTGVFTELDEGNQMRRALLGFGSGKSKIQLYVMLADASSEHQLYETASKKSKGKHPGAVIALNPYAGAASFVVKFGLTKNAPEKMVKDTASKVAKQVADQLNSTSSTITGTESVQTVNAN